MKLTRLFTLGVLTLALLANSASAALVAVAPGATVLLTPETSAVDLPGIGPANVLATQALVLLNSGGGVGAVVNEAVIREASGTLDFLYQIRNTSGTGITEAQLSGTDFTGVSTVVGSVTDVPAYLLPTFITPNNQNPTNATRATGPGSTVSFDGFSILPGQIAGIMLIKTNATAFNNFGAATVSSDILGLGSATNVGSYQPAIVTAIPEPTSVALLGIGCLGVLGFSRYRKARV